MKRSKPYLLVLFLLAILCISSVSSAKEKLAVMELKAKGDAKKSIAEALSVEVRDAIHNQGDYEVLSKEDLAAIADRTRMRQSLGCDDTQCLIDFGQAIGTKYMVAGSISKLGDTYSINLRLIDTEGEDAGVKSRASEKCRCAEDELFGTAKAVAALVMGKKKGEVSAPVETAGRMRTTRAEKTPGKPFTNSIGMKFVYIPPGTFLMGSSPGKPRRNWEETQHQVTLTEGFFMQTTEVTQGQWTEIMGENLSFFKECGDDCPVERVPWDEARQFIRLLNRREKTDKYRLPTEAEWEYACRAGTATAFSFGRCLDTEQANFGGTPMPGCAKGEYRETTVPVGSFPPNAFGLYDMHGNVAEWCEDWYGYYPEEPVTDPEGPPMGDGRRVMRGGAWNTMSEWCRSAYRRSSGLPNSTGFRVARTY
ncbi:MAG: SUMF1/EgtB/PvdO family nonheme iron enzyme [Deltaproteobacteria bacterium]|nr:SUMF1/EgtB/PvdO family nonheme iron enzyme [Deltaproteobacteria bacterium]